MLATLFHHHLLRYVDKLLQHLQTNIRVAGVAYLGCCTWYISGVAELASTGVMNRRTVLTLRVVIVTSLIWFLIDVFLLMYFTDCSTNRDVRSPDCNVPGTGIGKLESLRPTPGPPGPSVGPVADFFNKIIPDGRTFLQLF